MFDDAVLHDYVRNDAYDMTVMQEIFAGEQKQNEGDGATTVAMTEVQDFMFLDISEPRTDHIQILLIDPRHEMQEIFL